MDEAVVTKVRAKICTTGKNSWKVAESTDPVDQVHELDIGLEIQGDKRNGYHLVMSPEGAELLKSEIYTADAEQPRFTFEQGRVALDFVDWQEEPVKVVFDDAVAVRWQDVDSTGPQERNDCAYEILDSEWLDIHLSQNVAELEHRHLRLCFNACGVFDVICKTFVVTHL